MVCVLSIKPAISRFIVENFREAIAGLAAITKSWGGECKSSFAQAARRRRLTRLRTTLELLTFLETKNPNREYSSALGWKKTVAIGLENLRPRRIAVVISASV